jgi:hypothetical protein
MMVRLLTFLTIHPDQKMVPLGKRMAVRNGIGWIFQPKRPDAALLRQLTNLMTKNRDVIEDEIAWNLCRRGLAFD